MNSFLSDVAQDIIENSIPCETIIMPTRRMGRVFLTAFASFHKKPIFQPKFLTIDEWINSESEEIVIDPLPLLCEFIDLVYASVDENECNVTEMISMARSILSDINLIDLHLLSSTELFSKMHDIIDLNTNDTDKLKSFSFESQWAMLGKWIEELHEKLKFKKLTTRGRLYRSVSEKKSFKINPNRLILVGFSTLTPVEMKLFQSLLGQGAKAYWDSDSYYMNDFIAEAGIHLRQAKKILYSKNTERRWEWTHRYIESHSKKIVIHPHRHDVDQVKRVSSIVEEFLNKNSTERLGIILADEKSLPLILSGLPERLFTDEKKINITMGLPFQSTQMGQFISAQCEEIKSGKLKISAKEWIELLKIRINETFTEESAFINSMIEEINTLLVDYQWIENSKKSLEFVASVFLEKINAHRLSFSKGEGDAQSQIQVMGVLETRGLDFDHVIFCSMNEKVFPATPSNKSSLITQSLRKFFGIKMSEDDDALFAYQFYRLMQRACVLHCMYFENDVADSIESSSRIGSSEKSRFITQIEHELTYRLPKVKVEYVDSHSFSENKNNYDSVIEIEKTKDVIEKISVQLQKGISPTQLQVYMQCPLKYWFRYGLDLKEDALPDQLEQPNVIGNVIHSALEMMYRPLVGVDLHGDIINELKSQSATYIDKAICKILDLNDNFSLKGKAQLTRHAIVRFIERYLDFESHRITQYSEKIRVQKIEFRIERLLKIKRHDLDAKLLGTIDRIESIGSNIHIIDFKTGKVNVAECNKIELPKFSDCVGQEAGVSTILFQLSLYSFLISPIYPRHFLGVVPLASNQVSVLNAKSLDNSKEIQESIETDISQLCAHMIDPSIAIRQTMNKKLCEFCEFKEICNFGVTN